MAKSNYPHKQRNGGSNRGALIALLVLLIIAAAVFLLRSCTDGKTPDPAPGGIVYDPGAVEGGWNEADTDKIVDALNEKVEQGMINISMNTTPTFQNGSSAGNLMIVNESVNNYPQVVEIHRNDTGEVIYKSGAIPVGSKLETAKLSADLDAGTYECTALFYNVDPDSGEYLGCAGAVITVTVLECMKKHTSKLIALVLALCLCLSLSVSAFAAEIDSSGGSGSTPVNLSSTSDGTEGGDPSATAMRVTVPTALPMAMSQDGDVTTANNCQIVNHSYGAVRVKSVSITAASGWKLTAFGNKSILAGEKVDSNKLGFAISIGGGQQKATDASNANTQTLIDAPIAGCYMTGVGDSTGNTVKIDYAAIVTPLSSAVTGATVANVVFIVEWDTAA